MHLKLYEKLDATLHLKQREALEKLLKVNEGDTETDFSRICEKPKKPTLSFMRNWTLRLAWLKQIIDTSKLFDIINPTKVHQFAAQVENLETRDLLDPDMKRHIQASTTKVESFNNFSDWVTFGGKTLRTGDPVEMEKRIKYADLIANIVMLHNVIDLTDVLNEMNAEGETVTGELVEKLSPLTTQHLRRFGIIFLDMDDLPDPLEQKGLDFLD